MKGRKFSITTPLLAAIVILIAAANILLGVVLTSQSRSSMRSLISSRMLDISNTAARMIDGDVLKHLTKEDADTPEYQQQQAILGAFQKSIDLEFIYGIHNDGGDHFSFTIDPDENDPGEFGEQVESTPALRAAFGGVASVDEEPHEDRWGRFYSAYSPVFDSEGKIAGVIGVDFSAKWYEERVSEQVMSVVIVCVVSTLVSILLALAFSSRIRDRFTELCNEMNSLAEDFDDLGRLIQKDGATKTAPKPEETHAIRSGNRDEIAELGKQIHSIQTELGQYITYVHSQAYTDEMTGVGSKTAYLNKVGQLEKLIEEKNADFSVAVFDLNWLKTVNGNYGHKRGDEFINGAAALIKSVFGTSNVYRIGGDEFIAVLEGCGEDDMARLFDKFDRESEAVNESGDFPVPPTVSKGAAVFSSETDSSYKQVFKRADEDMYRCKLEYHSKTDGSGFPT